MSNHAVWKFFPLFLALASACQPVATLKPLPSTALQAQSRSTEILPLFEVDGATDRWTENRFRDFDQGLVKENLDLQTQGRLLLKSSAHQGRYLSRAYQAPFAFNALMPAWTAQIPEGAGLRVFARVSNDAQAWGNWLPLIQERSLILPQSARFVQYQVIFNSAQTPQMPVFEGMTFQFGKTLNRSPIPPALKTQGLWPKPEVVSRDAWKAVPPKGEYTPHTPDGLVIHHTWKPRSDQYQKDLTIRGIQKFHMVDNNWMDIGYHFLIGPDGVIYQGRPETVVGAHSTPNTGKVGICLIGDFDPGQDPVTPEAYAALLDLVTWLTSEYGISTQEFYGHRDFSTKSCPGDEVYHRLEAIKAEVKRRLELKRVSVWR